MKTEAPTAAVETHVGKITLVPFILQENPPVTDTVGGAKTTVKGRLTYTKPFGEPLIVAAKPPDIPPVSTHSETTSQFPGGRTDTRYDK